MRHGKWRLTAAKQICMALRISVGLFCAFLGLGLGCGWRSRLLVGSRSFFFVNWAHAVGGQWGITNQKMKKGAEGTNTRGRLMR
jgi:hypothetical protein